VRLEHKPAGTLNLDDSCRVLDRQGADPDRMVKPRAWLREPRINCSDLLRPDHPLGIGMPIGQHVKTLSGDAAISISLTATGLTSPAAVCRKRSRATVGSSCPTRS
jgi:hypothetical protein